MTTPLPGNLGYGTVRWTVVGIAEDSLDADALPDAEQINGTARFTPQVTDGAGIASGAQPPVTVLPRPVSYNITNGKLVDREGRTDIRLVANDSQDTTPQGWTYLVEYELDGGYAFGSFSFTLATNEIADLTLKMPVTSTPGIVITRGPAGPPGEGYGGGFVAPTQDGNLPLPITIVSKWGIRDDGTAYYNSAGAVSSEAGLLVPDPNTGGFTIWRPGAPFATSLDTRVRDLVNATSPLSLVRTALNTLYASTVTAVAGASATAAANALTKYDGGGSLVAARMYSNLSPPTSAPELTRKDYVDTQVATRVATSLLGANSGVATLDSAGKIPVGQMPAVALTEWLGAVGTQTAMLALTGQRGDWATRTDRGTDWQLINEPASTLANWREMTYPTSPVTSVDGRVGAVTLGTTTATADELARRTSAGRLLAADATAVGELTTLGQQTTAISDSKRELNQRYVVAATPITAADLFSVLTVGNPSRAQIFSVSIPVDTTLSAPIGAWFDVAATGVGPARVVGDSGVTVDGDTRVYGVGGTIRMLKMAANRWMIIGRSNPTDAYARCYAYADTQVLGWGAGWKHMPCNAELSDTHGGHVTGAITGEDTDSTPAKQSNRYTVQPGQEGTYRFSGQLNMTVGVSATIHCRFLKNGTFFRGCHGAIGGTSISGIVQTGVKHLDLVVGDYIGFQGYCNVANWNTTAGEDISGGATSYFEIERIA